MDKRIEYYCVASLSWAEDAGGRMPRREDEYWASRKEDLRYCSKHKLYYRASPGCQACGEAELARRQHTLWLEEQMGKGADGNGKKIDRPDLLRCPRCRQQSLFFNVSTELYDCLKPTCRKKYTQTEYKSVQAKAQPLRQCPHCGDESLAHSPHYCTYQCVNAGCRHWFTKTDYEKWLAGTEPNSPQARAEHELAPLVAGETETTHEEGLAVQEQPDSATQPRDEGGSWENDVAEGKSENGELANRLSQGWVEGLYSSFEEYDVTDGKSEGDSGMGKEDRDWYRGRHPAACTCVRCEEERQCRARDPKLGLGRAPRRPSRESREFAFGKTYMQRERKREEKAQAKRNKKADGSRTAPLVGAPNISRRARSASPRVGRLPFEILVDAVRRLVRKKHR